MKTMFDKYDGGDFRRYYVYKIFYLFSLLFFKYLRYKQCGYVNPAQWNARSIILLNIDEIILSSWCNESDICFRNAIKTFELRLSFYNKYSSYCS